MGNVPDAAGWLEGVPPLALEYASIGQDEAQLQKKIAQLIAGGTKLVWVVRLTGPRRVEVYEPGRDVRVVGPGTELSAPGILRNAVPVEAFYDRASAHALTLRNLLQRLGYESLDAVRRGAREEGRQEGRDTALRDAVRALGDVLGIEWSSARDAAVAAMTTDELGKLIAVLRRERRWPAD